MSATQNSPRKRKSGSQKQKDNCSTVPRKKAKWDKHRPNILPRLNEIFDKLKACIKKLGGENPPHKIDEATQSQASCAESSNRNVCTAIALDINVFAMANGSWRYRGIGELVGDMYTDDTNLNSLSARQLIDNKMRSTLEKLFASMCDRIAIQVEAASVPRSRRECADRLDAIEKRCSKMEAKQQRILDDMECLRYQVADSKAWHLLDKFIDCSVVKDEQDIP